MGPDLENEDELFAEAVKDVKPLDPSNLAERPPARVSQPRRIHGEKPAAETETAFDEMSFVRNGIQKSVLRKLRNGQLPIEAQLDLHGLTASEAEAALRTFIGQAQVPDRQRAVRIIHGKGLRSPDGKPVLKRGVRDWLFKNDLVLACCQAGAADGGSGAVHLLLRRK